MKSFSSLLSKSAATLLVSGLLCISQSALAAEFIVDTLDDNETIDSFTTLREAIILANADPDGDTISFSVNGTISLGSALPTITEEVTIEGNGSANTVIDGMNAHRIFFVVTSAPISISDMTLQNGYGKGGDGAVAGSNNGGGHGGGGMGAGGAVFFIGATNAELNGIDFIGNDAVGGNGVTGTGGSNFGGGGGGLLGNGGLGPGNGGDGPSPYQNAGGGFTSSNGDNGAFGGGGGGGGGGGLPQNGGNGGFGGGGGGGGEVSAGSNDGGIGGFGGGGGGGGNDTDSFVGNDGDSGNGGSFGGNGGSSSVFFRSGGGAGLGGAVFVYSTTNLTITSCSFTNNSATGGTGANNGSGRGGGIFVMSGGTVTGADLSFSGNNSGNASGTGFTPGVPSDTEDVYGVISADVISPDVVIGSVDSPTSAATILDLAVTFDEDVSGLEISDFITTGGLIVTDLTGGPDEYFIDLLSTGGDGVKEIQLPVGAADDLSSNSSNASNVVSYTLDTTVPFVTSFLDSIDDPTSVGTYLDVPLVFNEPVSGVEISDFLLSTGLTISDITGSGDTYLVDFEATTDGLNQFMLLVDRVSDSANNQNAAQIAGAFTLDTVAPTLTLPLDAASGQADPTSMLPILFELQFDEPISSFTTDNINTSLSTASGPFTVMLSSTKGAPEPIYQISVDGATSSGDVTVSLELNAIKDLAGNAFNEAVFATVEYVDTTSVDEWMMLEN